MSKNILVLGSRDSGSKNSPEIIAQSIASEDVSAQTVYWEDLVFDIQEGAVEVHAGGQSIFDKRVDMVLCFGWYKSGKKSIYRDVAYCLAQVLKHKNIQFWNSEMLSQRSTTKLSNMVQLALANLPVPRTVFCLDKLQVMNMLEFPYIAKAAAASRGKMNYLVSNQSEIKQYTTKEEAFILQPYIANDHDLRLICFGGAPKLILKRSRAKDSSSHLNNTSQGAKAEWIALSSVGSEVLTLAGKISTICQREMAGIDLIADSTADAGYRCLEVNAIPQLTSGFDVDKKINAFREVMQNL